MSKSNVSFNEVDYTKAKQMVVNALHTKRTPIIHGHPGTGKTWMAAEVAKELNLKLVTIHLSNMEPPEINGYAQINKDGRSEYFPFEMFPLERDSIPVNPETNKPYAGFLLFLDEFTDLSPESQKPAYRLVNDHYVGFHKLHPKTKILCAGNLIDSGALAEEMSSALGSRMFHIVMRTTAQNWIDWAMVHGIDYRIISWLKQYPNHFLKQYDGELTHCNGRSLHILHDIITAPHMPKKLSSSDHFADVSGAIGLKAGADFLTHLALDLDLVSDEEILANPVGCKLPSTSIEAFMVATRISSLMAPENATAYLQFFSRMPFKEHAALAIKSAIKRDSSLLSKAPNIVKWMANEGVKLL